MQQLPLYYLIPANLAKSLLMLSFGLVLLDKNLTAQAQITPNGAGTVVNTQGNQINIAGGTQAGTNLFHSFADFNVNSAQVANFLSNPQTQNILSRINGGNPSFINGLLQVTGGNSNLFLMNPAGIVFGQGASLNVPASFTATTANQIGLGNNQYFAATGNNNYAALTGNPDSFLFTTTQAGSIVNAGNLAVGSGQSISLIAGNTINTGRLTAPGGEIQVLAVPGTNRVRLSQPGQVLSLEIVLPDSNELKAVDLPALLTGSDLPGIVVNPSGQVEVAGTSLPNQQGLAVASGWIDVSSSGGNGGTVQIMGDRVAVLNSRINANGATGGGTVRLGGEYLGGRDTVVAPELRFNSQRTLVDRDSLIRANATVTGEGGRVIVWADQHTGYFGRIMGRGATGRGGFVEVSGKENLAFDGRVELQGLNGLGGTLLLDPANIVIGAATTDDAQIADGIIGAGEAPGATWFISAGALASIAAGTAIDIAATNNIDFQTNVNFTGGAGAAPITFTAGNITSAAVTLNTRGRSITMNAASINTPNLNITTRPLVNTDPIGNITLSASNGDLNIRSLSTNNISASTFPGGNVTLTSTGGNITLLEIISFSNSGNGGAVNLNATGGGITFFDIRSLSNSGNGGAINLNATGGGITKISGGNIRSLSNSGNGGAINLNATGGGITIIGGDIVSLSNSGNGGAINLNATGGGITIISGILFSTANIGDGGAVILNATGGGITSNIILSYSNSGNGGSINLTSTGGGITSGGLFSYGGGANNTSGSITIDAGTDPTTGNLVRLNGNNSIGCTNASVCSAGQGGAGNGSVTIRHNGGTTTPFIIGNATTNGTAATIDAGNGNIINTTFSVPVPPATYTEGIINIITTVPVVPPAVTPAVSPTISPDLLTLLRNPAPPATPAPVVVGAPPETIAVVESPIPAPIVSPVVVEPPVVTPPIVSQPVEVVPPVIIPPPTLIPAPSPTSALPVILEAIDPQDLRREPESPRGNLVLITNPSSTEIASRLELLELGTRARLRLFEPVVPNTLPPSQTSDYQYNLSAIQNNLNQANQTTGLKSALVYVFFAPHSSGIKDQDTLEVIMINGSGEPLRVQFLDVDRRQVLAVANRLQNSSIYLPRPQNLDNTRQDDRNAEFMVINPIGEAETVRSVPLSNHTSFRTRLTTSAEVDDPKDDPRFDLNAAQQVYQWLLAPLESDLQQQGINNLVFILDQELSNIPLEAIHDGQSLIRERYAIARTN